MCSRVVSTSPQGANVLNLHLLSLSHPHVWWGSATDLMVGKASGGDDSSTSGDHMRAQKYRGVMRRWA